MMQKKKFFFPFLFERISNSTGFLNFLRMIILQEIKCSLKQ